MKKRGLFQLPHTGGVKRLSKVVVEYLYFFISPLIKTSAHFSTLSLRIRLFILGFFAFSSYSLIGQNYPVDLNVMVLPPHSSAYYTFTQLSGFQQANKIQVTATLKDLVVDHLDIGLELELIGSNGIFRSDPSFRSQPFTLTKGFPTMISNQDLAGHFLSNGLSEALVNNGGFLPEGEWQVCVTAFELLNGEQVSRQSCYYLFLEEFDPPEIIFPEDSILPTFPQNIQVGWQPLHIGSFPVRYEYSIWESIDGFADNQIVESTIPVFSKSLDQQTTDWLTSADPPLVVGQEYIIQVQIADNVNGVMGPPVYAFKNNGLSEIKRFKYGMMVEGEDCTPPEGLAYTVDDSLKYFVFWDGGKPPVYDASLIGSSNNQALQNSVVLSSNGSSLGQIGVAGGTAFIGNTAGNFGFYKMFYRDVDAGDSAWKRVETEDQWVPFNDFKRGRNYEVYVSKVCSAEERASESIPINFPVLPPARDFMCGMPPLDINLSNETPLPQLQVNDTIMAGDFRVVVTEASGGNGRYSGEGFFQMGLFNARIGVEFNDILVNDEYRMTDGFMETMTDPLGGNIFNTNTVTDLFNAPDEPFPVIEMAAFEGATFMNGQVVVYPGGDTYDSPLRVKTPDGDILLTGGMVLKEVDINLPSELSTDYSSRFLPDDGQFYGFDEVDDKIKSEYRKFDEELLPHKSVAYGGFDYAQLKITKTKEAWTSASWDSVRLVTESKFEIEFDKPGTSTKEIRIKLPGLEGEELIYVLYNDECMGALNLAPYTLTNYTVNLVPVNGAGSNANIGEIERQVNKILGKGVVSVQMNLLADQNFVFEDSDGELAADTEILDAYSEDMKALLEKHLDEFGQEENQLYLFLVDNLEGNVEGFMADGQTAGFIDIGASKLAHTIAHELGHGAFTLRHFWQVYDPVYPKGSSDNLMDYSNGDELIYKQWNRMHNQRFPTPWFKKGEEQMQIGEGKIACVDLSLIENLSNARKFLDPNQKLIELPIGATPLSFYRKDENQESLRGILHAFEFENKKYEVGFNYEGDEPSFLGYYYRYKDEEGKVSTEKYGYTGTDAFGIKIVPEVSVNQITYFAENETEGIVYQVDVNYCNNNVTFEETDLVGICEFEMSESEIDENFVDRLAKRLDEMIEKRSSISSPIRPRGSYHHIQSVDYEKAPLPKAELDVFDERLYLLSFHTGFDFYVIYASSQDQYSKGQSSSIAQRVLQKSIKKTDKTIVVTLPYSNKSSSIEQPCGYPGYASSFPVNIENTSNVQSVADYLTRIYSALEKPLNVTALLYLSDGSIFELASKSEENVVGYPLINSVQLYQSRLWLELRNLLGQRPLLTQTSESALKTYLEDMDVWEEKVLALREKAMIEELKALNGEGLEQIMVRQEDKLLLRESYCADKKVVKAYAAFHYENDENYVRATLKEDNNGYEINDQEHLHEEITPHDIVYNSLDAMALMLAPTGADIIMDVAGVMYTLFFNTKAVDKALEYSAGIAVVFGLDKAAKGSAKAFKVLRNVENGKVTYKLVDPGYVIQKNEDWVTKLYAKNRLEAEAQLQELVPKWNFEAYYKQSVSEFQSLGLSNVELKELTDDISRFLPHVLENPRLIKNSLGSIVVRAGPDRLKLFSELTNLKNAELEQFLGDINESEKLLDFVAGDVERGLGAWGILKNTKHSAKVDFLEFISNLKGRGFKFEEVGSDVKLISGTEGVELGIITDSGLDIEDFGYIAKDVAASNIEKLPLDFPVFDSGNDFTGKLEVVTDASGNTKFRWSSGSGKPQWLKTIEEGNKFNNNRKDAFPYNEIYLYKPGGGYVRLDSYDPIAGEIISRKFSQLSDVNETTALNYVSELFNKYDEGSVIATVTSNLTGANKGILNSGSSIQGTLFLEVPVQTNNIPQKILQFAEENNVLIRDINGTIY